MLVAAAAGEHGALHWLLDEVAPIVYGFVYARVGGDDAAAEDVLQETLMEAVKGASNFRGDGPSPRGCAPSPGAAWPVLRVGRGRSAAGRCAWKTPGAARNSPGPPTSWNAKTRW